MYIPCIRRYNRYNHKCRRRRVESWIDRNALKFISLSRRQWEKYAPMWNAQYPELVKEFRALEQRFYSLSDLLDHDDGLVPSLKVDKDLIQQRNLKYIRRMRVDIAPKKRGLYPNVEYILPSLFLSLFMSFYLLSCIYSMFIALNIHGININCEHWMNLYLTACKDIVLVDGTAGTGCQLGAQYRDTAGFV